MKALIFNSGVGKRMGELTAHNPKSMVALYNGETIFERQIRLLQEAGIEEVVITTGPYPEMLKEICAKPRFSNMVFHFPHNEIYDSSNYIYSMFKAIPYIQGSDVLILHGDLVFDHDLVPAMLADKRSDLCLIDPLRSQPEKDFKGRIRNGLLQEVSVQIFDADCYAFQPLYKLSAATLDAWLKRVSEFIEAGTIGVYAENALNEITSSLHIVAKSYHNHFLAEVDDAHDLALVNQGISARDMDYQRQFKGPWKVRLAEALKRLNAQHPFFVVDSFLAKEVEKTFPESPVFSAFTPNPNYEDIIQGIELFQRSNCDAIVCLGGGSCIDVAKVIKYSCHSSLDDSTPTFKQPYRFPLVPLIAIATTSGTGSESTRHAAIYLSHMKQSFSHFSLIPDVVIFDPALILSVPPFIKKSTALDAFCQCVESTWSKKATPKSRRYARRGIALFKSCLDGYLAGEEEATAQMQVVANLSGKAINISETTAGHAMSYGITTKYGVPHGYAVALSLLAICHRFTFDIKKEYYPLTADELSSIFTKMELSEHLGKDDAKAGADELTGKVNIERLGNFPYVLDEATLHQFYLAILS